MLILLKGLPLAYQRDLQEDKAPLFDGVATFGASLEVLSGLLDGLPSTGRGCAPPPTRASSPRRPMADALVRRGLPFRVAHHVVGRLVARAEADEVGLGELRMRRYRGRPARDGRSARSQPRLRPGRAGRHPLGRLGRSGPRVV